MDFSFSFVLRYFVVFALQTIGINSEHFTVISSGRQQVVAVGEQAELSCQLSPPQNATHMYVRWFRDHYSQPVLAGKRSEGAPEKSTGNYVNRTVLVEELHEGKTTLIIHNTSLSDEGKYHCLFKDGDTSKEATVDLKVAAMGLEIQINVQVPDTDGFLLECSSEGWFPPAQMQWRDSNGTAIPHTSKSYSEDRTGLFNLKMSLLLKNSANGSVTCCFRNPVTGQEKRAGVFLPDILFKPEYMSMVSNTPVCPLTYLIIVLAVQILKIKTVSSMTVSVSDDPVLLYSSWMSDICLVLTVMMSLFTGLLVILLYSLINFLPENWRSPL